MTDFRALMVENAARTARSGIRTFSPIPAGDFSLSVQASTFHYCDPREDLDVLAYQTFEVALFTADNAHWINPSADARFAGLACIEMWDPLRTDDTSTSVGGHVPVAAVQELYERCLSISAAKGAVPS